MSTSSGSTQLGGDVGLAARRRAAAGRAARAGSGRARRAGPAPAPRAARPSTGARSSSITSTRARSTWRRNWWPRPRALGRALDEAGDVGEHELVVAEAHHAEVRLERGERVVGDLGLGRAHRRDQRATCPRWGSRRARRRRAASPRGAASAPRRTRPARRSSARAGRSTGSGRCRGRPARRAPRGSGRRGARGRRAARRRGPCTCVPSGTVDHEVGARWRRAASCPTRACPTRARRCGWSRNASSDATLRSACRQTSPPEPPSPPSGPPFGTCASRRNDTAPAPPSPPRRLTWTTSTNDDMPISLRTARPRAGSELPPRVRRPTRVRPGRCRRACGPCGGRTSPCRSPWRTGCRRCPCRRSRRGGTGCRAGAR